MPGENDLHGYQKFCVNFLEEKPQCALFLDCGLGKTIRAWKAGLEKKKKEPRRAYIDEVWGNLKPA